MITLNPPEIRHSSVNLPNYENDAEQIAPSPKNGQRKCI